MTERCPHCDCKLETGYHEPSCPVRKSEANLNRAIASQINEDVPHVKEALDKAFKTIAASETCDMVDHPAHYGGADNPYEAIKVIDAWKLGFALGNTVKYIARAAHKGSELEDLKKARWYLDHRIKQLETLNGGLISLSGGPIYTKVELHLATNELGLGGSRKAACGQWASSWTERLSDVTCKSCLKHRERNPTHLLALIADGFASNGIACGKKDAEVSSVVTAGSLSEVTCKECRAAFIQNRAPGAR